MFRELQSTFSRLAHLVDISRGDLASQLKQIRDEMTKLDELGGKSRKLRYCMQFVVFQCTYVSIVFFYKILQKQ